MCLAPIALFVYNRPQHTQKVLRALSACEEAKDSELFIFADGAKKDASKQERDKIKETRNIIRTSGGFKTKNIVVSERNKGLALSIINGVRHILNKYDKIIVLEDDLVCSPWFLTYMNMALDIYEKENRIISISGYIYPIRKKLPETFFLRGADCWGWATWKRGWDIFNEDGSKLLAEIKSKGLEFDFDFYGSYPYTKMLRHQIEGKNSSWAIRWYASAYLKNKLTLYPNQSLIQNIGMDNSGVHCESSNAWDINLLQKCPDFEKLEVKEFKQGKFLVADFFLKTQKKYFRKKIKLYLKKIWMRN